MNEIENAKRILIEYDQQNLLKILDKLDVTKQQNLAKQVLNIDFNEIIDLYKNRNKKDIDCNDIEPIEVIDKNKINDEEKIKLSNIGKDIISNNQYAVVTMAGGQGTRLGFKGAKGTFKLDIGENGKYIFEILADTLKKSNIQYNGETYWYIMTSINNNKETVNFFEEHNYFGYNKEKVKFFNQNTLPLIDKQGNLLLDNNLQIKKASDGNGGVYKSLKKSGMIEDMKEKGIKWVYICGVDNIMAKMADPLLLGLTVNKNVFSASKSVKKSYPEEKVGIFCKKNGKPAIIEYIDMTQEMIYKKDEEGELLYGDSNIVSHLFNLEFLEKMAEYKLKYHCAEKLNSYLDENLQEVMPTDTNTYKFESFVFDGFEYLDNMLIMRVNREEEFAPIKNANGVDSPKTAKKIYENYLKNA